MEYVYSINIWSMYDFSPVSKREDLLRSQGHGAWTGGHFAGKGEAGGGALFDLLVAVQVLVRPHLLWQWTAWGGRQV